MKNEVITGSGSSKLKNNRKTLIIGGCATLAILTTCLAFVVLGRNKSTSTNEVKGTKKAWSDDSRTTGNNDGSLVKGVKLDFEDEDAVVEHNFTKKEVKEITVNKKVRKKVKKIQKIIESEVYDPGSNKPTNKLKKAMADYLVNDENNKYNAIYNYLKNNKVWDEKKQDFKENNHRIDGVIDYLSVLFYYFHPAYNVGDNWVIKENSYADIFQDEKAHDKAVYAWILNDFVKGELSSKDINKDFQKLNSDNFCEKDFAEHNSEQYRKYKSMFKSDENKINKDLTSYKYLNCLYYTYYKSLNRTGFLNSTDYKVGDKTSSYVDLVSDDKYDYVVILDKDKVIMDVIRTKKE